MAVASIKINKKRLVYRRVPAFKHAQPISLLSIRKRLPSIREGFIPRVGLVCWQFQLLLKYPLHLKPVLLYRSYRDDLERVLPFKGGRKKLQMRYFAGAAHKIATVHSRDFLIGLQKAEPITQFPFRATLKSTETQSKKRGFQRRNRAGGSQFLAWARRDKWLASGLRGLFWLNQGGNSIEKLVEASARHFQGKKGKSLLSKRLVDLYKAQCRVQ